MRARAARRHRARGLPVRDRARRTSTSIASTSCSSARRASRPAPRAVARSRRSALVRGEVLEDEPYARLGAGPAGQLPGPRPRGAPRRGRRRARRARSRRRARPREAAAALDRFSERAQRTAMLALYALGRQHEALARYRAFRSLLDEELGLEPTARDARARGGDPPPGGRPLASPAADRDERGAPATNAVRPARPHRRARRALRRGIRERARRPPRADPDRGRERARQDAAARRARGEPARRAPSAGRAAPRSSGTCPTCRSPRRCATRSPASSSTAGGLPPLAADPSRSSRSGPPRPAVRRGRGARGAGRARRRACAARAADRRPALGRPPDARRARLPAPPRRRPRRGAS